MKRRRTLCIVMLLMGVWAGPLRAAEREWELTTGGVMGLLVEDKHVAVGFGGEVLALYGFSDWLSVGTQMGGIYFPTRKQAPAHPTDWGTAYAATRLTVLPLVRLSPALGLWTKALGEYFVPSVAFGVGYLAEIQRNRISTYRGGALRDLENSAQHQAIGSAAIGFDCRPSEVWAFNLHLRYTMPFGAQFGQVQDIHMGLAASLNFYP